MSGSVLKNISNTLFSFKESYGPVFIIYRYVTNYPKTQWLETTFISSQSSVLGSLPKLKSRWQLGLWSHRKTWLEEAALPGSPTRLWKDSFPHRLLGRDCPPFLPHRSLQHGSSHPQRMKTKASETARERENMTEVIGFLYPNLRSDIRSLLSYSLH